MKNVILAIVIFIFLLSACSLSKPQNEKILRLGFMPNVTHATALIGIEKEFFQNELGKDVIFKPVHFVVGNSIIDAFITGQIDVAYVGPGPFINAIYRKIPIKLLANACNGGTVIVGALHATPLQNGSRIAIPQYGNTQDLILRLYLKKNNLLDKIKIFAIPPQDTGTAFFTMSIDAACLPEPWGTILTKNVGACHGAPLQIIVNEKDILNNGDYPVSLLVADGRFAKNNPELIQKLLTAHKRSNEFINKSPQDAMNIVTKAISNISKKQVDENIIAESFKRCIFTDNIDLNIFKEFARIGIKSGYYKEGFLQGKNEISFN